jgi:hypothetical protein
MSHPLLNHVYLHIIKMTTQTTQWGGTFSWRKTMRIISQNNDATIMRYLPSSYVNKFDPLDITNYNNDNNKKVNDTILYDCWNGGTLHSLCAQLTWCLVTHETIVNNLLDLWSLHISFAPMNKLHKLLSWNQLVSMMQTNSIVIMYEVTMSFWMKISKRSKWCISWFYMIIVVNDSNTTNRKDFLMCSKAITTKYSNTNVNVNPSYTKFELDQGHGM